MQSTTTEAQRRRYARRVWAEKYLSAQMTPETAMTPLEEYGPKRPTVAQVRDCYALYAANGWYLTPLLRQARNV